jgi:hypothetical protein
MRHRIVCVFASPRSGSNLLCEQLTDAISRVSDKRVVNLYELLSPHQHVSDDGMLHIVDRHDRLGRPDPMGLDLVRLRKLDLTEDRISVVKILPRDIHRGNIDVIDRMMLGDDGTYAMCLNRRDVANQIISYFISRSTGVWHSNQGGEILRGSTVADAGEMSRLGDEITMHYLWHAEMAGRFDQIVWYDQLLSTAYPGLLGHDSPLPASQDRLNADHAARARECITNADELIEFAAGVEASISSLRDSLG